jgi:hypothetical protein
MSTKRSKKPRPDFSTESLKDDQLLFCAEGKMLLGPNTRIPIRLQILSTAGPLPVLVELTSRSSLGELALRQGFAKNAAKLNVRGREFCARVVGRPKDSPLRLIHASDVFAALFPGVAFPKDGDNA